MVQVLPRAIPDRISKANHRAKGGENGQKDDRDCKPTKAHLLAWPGNPSAKACVGQYYSNRRLGLVERSLHRVIWNLGSVSSLGTCHPKSPTLQIWITKSSVCKALWYLGLKGEDVITFAACSESCTKSSMEGGVSIPLLRTHSEEGLGCTKQHAHPEANHIC